MLAMGSENWRWSSVNISRSKITFTPAQIQDYLLHYREWAADAAANIAKRGGDSGEARTERIRGRGPRERMIW